MYNIASAERLYVASIQRTQWKSASA